MEAPLLLAVADLPSLCIRNSTVLQVVHASNLKLRGPLLFEDVVFGDVLRFDAVKIEAGVRMSNTVLHAKGGALSLQGADIANDLQLRPEFQAAGSLMLRGLRVGGQLSFSGAILTHKATALNLDGAIVQGHLFLRDGFQSAGEVRLAGAEIGGQLDCSGARLTGEETSLCLDQAKVRGNVLLHADFEAAGSISMRGAEIDGNVDFEAASVGVVDGEGLEVKGDFLWRQLTVSDRRELLLRGARIKRLEDDRASWPRPGKLRVDGLVVQSFAMLEGASLDAADLMAWLHLQPESDLGEPQSWRQAAAMLKAKGRPADASRVLMALHRHQSNNRWSRSSLRIFGRAWDMAFACLEERPLRIAFAAALLLFAAGVFHSRDRLTFVPQANPPRSSIQTGDRQSPVTSPPSLTAAVPTAVRVPEPLEPATIATPKLPASSAEPVPPVDVEASSTASSFGKEAPSQPLHKNPSKAQKTLLHKAPTHPAKRIPPARH